MCEPVKEFMHLGISVKDLEHSIRFYTEVLNFKLGQRKKSSGEAVSRVVGVPNADMCAAILKKGCLYLELIDYQNNKLKQKTNYKQQDEPGLTHFAINFDDIESMYKKIKSMGYEFSAPPTVTRDGGHKIAYFKGPDNVIIELVEN